VKNKRLIKTKAEGPGQWFDEVQGGQLIQNHENFVDITDYSNSLKDVKPTDVNSKCNCGVIFLSVKYFSIAF